MIVSRRNIEARIAHVVAARVSWGVVWTGRSVLWVWPVRLVCSSVGPAEIGEEIALLNERILQAALQGALGVG